MFRLPIMLGREIGPILWALPPYSAIRGFDKGESDIWRRGHWKRGICIKLSEIDFQICDNFAHPSSDVRNEVPTILRNFGAQFATDLRNAPVANAPFSGCLTKSKHDIMNRTSR